MTKLITLLVVAIVLGGFIGLIEVGTIRGAIYFALVSALVAAILGLFLPRSTT